MPLKKNRNPLISIQNESENINLSLSDCSCPICLEVLVEPVVFPCKHELCLPCFNGMTDKTNFLCPMCRIRISTWSRSASNNNTLVNKERWEQIKKAFPSEIKDRMEGKTAEKLAVEIEKEKESNKENTKLQNIAKPGEIRKEYEANLQREQERLRTEREQEEQQSLQYIQQVIAQEERLTVSDYINRINNNTPQLNNNTQQSSNSLTPQIRQSNVHTPVISESNKTLNRAQNTLLRSEPRRRLLHHVNQTSVLPNTSLNNVINEVTTTPQQTNEENPQTSSREETVQRRICTRASIKRNIEDVKNIRAHLLTSIAESKAASIKAKAVSKSNVSFNTLSSDESSNNISTNDESLTVPHARSNLKRRVSARIASRTHNDSTIVDNNDSLNSSKVKRSASTIQRRGSIKNTRLLRNLQPESVN